MAIINSVYTDGACSGNPGPGGWGFVVYWSDNKIEKVGGGEQHTTNNRMKIKAALEAIKFIKANTQTEPINLYSDSTYVIDGVTKWMGNWQKKGWKKADKKEVINRDLWEEMYQVYHNTTYNCSIFFHIIRGHAGIEGNVLADKLAVSYVVK